MLRYLTHKLKTQSLNEADAYPSKNDDDHDSGTESDDEGADAEELEKYMDENSLQFDVSRSSSGSAATDRASSTLDSTLTDATAASPSSFLPDSALPSDSDQTYYHHSSEEELEVINNQHSKYNKRKWSQVNRLSVSSSDEEVRDLMCVSAPVEFRSSPPAHVPKPSRSLSPPLKLFHAATLPSHELALSPRKRHRSTNLLSAEHRPSLDFEKMQQNRRRRTTQGYHTRGKSYILCENV